MDKKKLPIHVISATRLSETVFWSESALGRSLKYFLSKGGIQASIHYTNKDGLPDIYNRHIESSTTDEILVFVHDDVWLESLGDLDWDECVHSAMDVFDVVGVVGNTRLVASQPGWCFRAIENNSLIPDVGHLSGFIGHGDNPTSMKDDFGPTPMECKVLDGVFFAVKSSVITPSPVRFDGIFDFDFYDLDFCRTAVKYGLRLGTYPISLTHQSNTNGYGSTAWMLSYSRYLGKWGS
ncbi:glycosyltransferase [Rhodoferax sp. GW822-FHT02A01]|uniref:glycosyltransferase n=1 Tax=Rhodoferax sp. GW822-FHT02A01 TaxID=3141537 RepID=UPI00315DD75D